MHVGLPEHLVHAAREAHGIQRRPAKLRKIGLNFVMDGARQGELRMGESQLVPRLQQNMYALAPDERSAKDRTHRTLGGKSNRQVRQVIIAKKLGVHARAQQEKLFLRNPCRCERLCGALGRDKQQVREIIFLQALAGGSPGGV